MPTSIGQFQGVDILPGTNAEVSVQVNKIRAGATAPQNPNSITSDVMKPTAPLDIPDTPTPVDTAGLEGAIGQSTSSLTAELEAQAKEREKTADEWFTRLFDEQSSAPGEVSLRNTAEQKFGVDTAEAELRDVNQQLLEEQQALRKQEERIRENRQGLETGGVEGELRRVRSESLSRQADLAVIQLSKQGRYDSAKAIADRAVAAKLETQRQELAVLELAYERNKDLFTTAEQRAFESKQADRKWALDMQAYKEQAKYAQMIKQNDPKYQAELKKVLSEINAGGGVTITNPLAGPYSNALNTILASGKFTKDQKASLIAGINQGEDPFTIVKNQAKNLLGQTGDTKLTGYEVARGQLDSVKDALDRYYAAGGKTGIFYGSYEQVINKLGEVDDPELVSVAVEIASALQIYRNAVSGTAYSVQEGKDIASIFPGINKTQGLNEAVLTGRARAFEATIDETYRSVLGSAYDQLKNANESGAKGQKGDSQFVEETLSRAGVSYDGVLRAVPSGKRAVINNKTGEIGYIEPSEFDSALYTSL